MIIKRVVEHNVYNRCNNQVNSLVRNNMFNLPPRYIYDSIELFI